MIIRLTIACLICIGTTMTVAAQDASPFRSQQSLQPNVSPFGEVARLRQPSQPRPSFPGEITVWRSASANELGQALAKLRETESEDDRNKSITEIRGLLSKQYDESLDRYEDYLAELEARLAKMKEQVDKRRDAKMELVDLRLKTLVNEADGLGWPSEANQSLFGAQSPSFYAPSFPSTAVPSQQFAPQVLIPTTPRNFSGPPLSPEPRIGDRITEPAKKDDR